jgi:DNA-binding beta-propeller fold protein YncE
MMSKTFCNAAETGQYFWGKSNTVRPLRCLMVFLFLASLSLAMAQPASAVRRTNVQHLFDITDNLNAASDVSVSKDGKIYVVDGVNHRIKVFNPNGKPIFSFGGEGSANGEFKFPLGIDIDKSGKVYVADSGNHRLQIFTPQGGFITKIDIPSKTKHPADPSDVAVDNSRNRCYVVDNDNHHILVYDLATLKWIQTYGSPGTDKRAFRYPFFITLDRNKYLYIVDVINTRVQVLNPDGLFVEFIGGWGVEKGEFFRPKGVAIDKDSRVFVSDSYMGVIQVFDADSNFYAVVADPASGRIKKFKTPAGLFIDSKNRLYVVEMLANKVSVYQIAGTTEEN